MNKKHKDILQSLRHYLKKRKKKMQNEESTFRKLQARFNLVLRVMTKQWSSKIS